MWETTVGSVSAPREREQNGVPRSIFTLSFQADVFRFKNMQMHFLNKEYIIPKELVTRRAEYNPLRSHRCLFTYFSRLANGAAGDYSVC